MVRVEWTNVVIDEFFSDGGQTGRGYTHVLTNAYGEWGKGIGEGWDGTIYCTEGTAKMLLARFPRLKGVKAIEMNTPTVLRMSVNLQVTLTFLDSNYCTGSAMVLLKGYMGTVLYTGGFRFNQQFFSARHTLYPHKLANSSFTGCSIPIDVLYLDNVYLKPKFNFPPQSVALQAVLTFVRKEIDLNRHSRIYIGLDQYGMEEVLVALALQYETYVVVDEGRYERLKAAGFDMELFRTRSERGFLHVVDRSNLELSLYKDRLSVGLSVGLVLGGWVTTEGWRHKGRIYGIPYSIHSNFQELHAFVDSIRPAFIEPIVRRCEEERFTFAEESSRVNLPDDYQDQLKRLRKKCCVVPSSAYTHLMANSDLKQKVTKQLQEYRLQKASGDSTLQSHQEKQALKQKQSNLPSTRDISEFREKLLALRAEREQEQKNQEEVKKEVEVKKEEEVKKETVQLGDRHRQADSNSFTNLNTSQFVLSLQPETNRSQKKFGVMRSNRQQIFELHKREPMGGKYKTSRAAASRRKTNRVNTQQIDKMSILDQPSQILTWLNTHSQTRSQICTRLGQSAPNP